LLQCPFVASRFAVVGPATDPARVAAAASAVEAFWRIARSRGPFVSRADSSGTNVKELVLWRAAGVTPRPPWYIESGTDQAATLHLADERNAYALADLPTYAKLGQLALRVLFTADTALANPYTLYVVRGAGPDLRAREFALWAMRVVRPAILALRLPDQTPAFVARPGGCTTPPPAGDPTATAKS
jgi:tungstate transport system substrate-binding protein